MLDNTHYIYMGGGSAPEKGGSHSFFSHRDRKIVVFFLFLALVTGEEMWCPATESFGRREDKKRKDVIGRFKTTRDINNQ